MATVTTLTDKEFDAACAELSNDLRLGMDISTAEMADRLGMSEEMLFHCSAAWVTMTTGEKVEVVRIEAHSVQ